MNAIAPAPNMAMPTPLPTASFATELSMGGTVLRLPGDATVWLVPKQSPKQSKTYNNQGISLARRKQLAQLLICTPMQAALQKLEQSGERWLNRGEWMHRIAQEYANQYKQLSWPANVPPPNHLEAQWWIDGSAALAEWTLIRTMKQAPTGKQLARWEPFIEIFKAEFSNLEEQSKFADGKSAQPLAAINFAEQDFGQAVHQDFNQYFDKTFDQKPRPITLASNQG
jgi:hypothetical protein